MKVVAKATADSPFNSLSEKKSLGIKKPMRILAQAEVTYLPAGWGRCSNRQTARSKQATLHSAQSPP